MTTDSLVFNERLERAFPSTYKSLDGEAHIHAWGMTLRDYFAAKALQGILTEADEFWEGAAPLAYQLADAMLKVRESCKLKPE